MFWGFSEAIDLCEEYVKNINENPTEINILLYGNGDPRNILKTLSKSFQHKVKLNFYVVDGIIEVVARNMLLLAIALEDKEILSLKRKTHIFMDIYGNSLLRPFSYNYMSSKADIFKKMITSLDMLETIAPLFNIDYLKYRERDSLEDTFNFWLARDEHVFNISTYWERRLRKMLGSRYDYKDGVFDWDLQMRLKDNEAQQLCNQEYKHWRSCGVAFTFPEYEQCQPNKTLAAGLIRNGRKYHHREYVGDVEVGPYSAFGLKSPNEEMAKSIHGVNNFRATDVTERNVMEMLYEIVERRKYEHKDEDTHKYGGVVLDVGKIIPACDQEQVELITYNKKFLTIPDAKIFFLSVDDIINLQNGDKFQKLFDVVFIGCNYFRFLKNNFSATFKNDAIILFETNLHSLSKKDVINEFTEKIKKYAAELNLKHVTNFNINIKHTMLKFKNDLLK